MARCPFAEWHPISGSSGPHVGGPFKIVHHTTEGLNIAGALQAFAKNRSDPHFTVDAARILQHIDTAEGARALRNASGGVQTNRDSAVQIELVGFAHLVKNRDALTRLARVCRWIEQVHGVPVVWPAGPPKPAINGRDPGGHNRDLEIWDAMPGHYGHCHVPENTHWDPAFTSAEVEFLMAARFDAAGRLLGPPPPPLPKRKMAAKRVTSTMPDHAHTDGGGANGSDLYISRLRLEEAATFAVAKSRSTRRQSVKSSRVARKSSAAPKRASVNAGSMVSFVDGISAQNQTDVLYSLQLAQRGATGSFDRFTQMQSWYQKYQEILENLGWASETLAFKVVDQHGSEFRMDQSALAILTAVATQNQLAIMKAGIDALGTLAESDGTVQLFDAHASLDGNGNFQIGSVQISPSGALTIALGAFYFRAVDRRRKFLFFSWGAQQLQFWAGAQRFTLNAAFYAQRRAAVEAKLGVDAEQFIADLKVR